MDNLAGNTANTSNPVDLRALPYRTRLVAEKIGLNATYILFKTFAHRTLYIPPTLLRSDLATKVGKEAATALIELWPNTSLTFPKVDRMFQQWRNYEIILDINDGELPIVEICIKYDLTRQRIDQIKKDHKRNQVASKATSNQNLTLDLLL
ncbi:Mor transcription activator domain protein [Colwellia psychrerythraea]|uniref:Mor transcription activator domain protein n=2 Tax=Colwellia psychrerythraea TaxID=28229 RepID=A0A099KN35_COLPS|nr:Mor transcription activator domain protein [Colwellia psychrerythraea]